ncbi:MAG: aldo/keto reductase [Chthonomonas sp.]|nr:aldo/keto reductase [Chthonomonas sp.]
MRKVALGNSDIQVSRLAYGCMRISTLWDPKQVTADHREKGKKALFAALDCGYTLFDHADIYARGVCEEIFGEALRESAELRSAAVIATKCGIRFAQTPRAIDVGRYDFSAPHILESCDLSLKRLGVERIDLYQLHRPDLLMDPDEVMEAITQLHRAGKIRTFGVSNFKPSTLALLGDLADHIPFVVHQIEVSLVHREPLFDGTLDQCLALGLTPLAWGPLGGGRMDNRGNETLAKLMDELAQEHSVTPEVIAIAWLLRHPSNSVPLIGSTNPDHIRDATTALDVDLSREDWYRLLVAAQGQAMP